MVNRVKKQKRKTRRGTRRAFRRGTRRGTRCASRRGTRRRARRVTRHRRGTRHGGDWNPFGTSAKAKEEKCERDKKAAETQIGIQARMLADEIGEPVPETLDAAVAYAVNMYNQQTKPLRVLGEAEYLPKPECDKIVKWERILREWLGNKLRGIKEAKNKKFRAEMKEREQLDKSMKENKPLAAKLTNLNNVP